MLDLLSNQWVVGIGGSTVSGVLTYFLTTWFVGKKNDKEYLSRIAHANSTIVDMLKPYIADNGLPDLSIINAIIASTSRQFEVPKDELFNAKIICEELIKEIIANVYVSSDKKMEYTNSLNTFLYSIQDPENDFKLITKHVTTKSNSMYFSLTLAILTTIISFFTIFGDIFDFFSYLSRDNLLYILILPIVSTALSLFLAASALEVGKKNDASKREIQVNKDQTD